MKNRQREEMFTTVDSLIVFGIQNLKQIAVLNLIFIDVGTTEPFNNFIQISTQKVYLQISINQHNNIN